jgi:hypothetical protein
MHRRLHLHGDDAIYRVNTMQRNIQQTYLGSLSHLLAFLLLAKLLSSFELTGQDRFRLICPADLNSIRQFAPTLVADVTDETNNDHVWVAVYRSQNNKPSVLSNDDFVYAMNVATATTSSDQRIEGLLSSTPIGTTASSPVAVARLRPVESDDNVLHFVLDSLRCVLIKENMDPDCDGGSEHNEALAAAIDALIHHYLDSIMTESKYPCFEGIIRAKATLFSARLLEDRGFVPVTELQKDMSTHVSSLDGCLERYASRSISTTQKSPGARQRAIDIVSKLGYIDRNIDILRAKEILDLKKGNGDEDSNPWGNSCIR